MAAVIQSPPHEIARQEKLAHLAAVDAREELQRRHSQGQADAGAEAERQARLAQCGTLKFQAPHDTHTGMAAFGEAPQASPLVKAISAGELEQKATTQQVKALAEEERKARIEADAERERASESERKSNADAADRAAEGERQERLQAQAKADAQEALVRAEAQRRSLELQDAERAERLAAGPQRSPLKGSKVLETVGDAAAELGADSVSCLRFGVASMASSLTKFRPHRTQGQRPPRRRRGRGGAPAPRRGRASRGARVRDRALVQC